MNRERHVALETVFLSAGFVLGAILSWAIVRWWPVSYEPIEAAKSLGIVSVTTLLNHPKHMEALYYAVFIVAVPSTAILCWLLYNRISSGAFVPSRAATYVEDSRPFPVLGCAVASLVAIYLTYYGAYFTTNWINSWYLFSEEGEVVSWAYSILSGEVLYRDNFSPYGPLMPYLLALMMKLFGATVFTSRLYAYLTYAVTAALIVVMSFAVLRQRWQALLTSLLLLSAFFPVKNSVNATPLRQFLGMLALFVFYRYMLKGSRKALVAAGLVAGAAFLYSQENGVAALVAVVSLWGVKAISNRGELKNILVDASYFIAAFLVAILPFMVYFYANGALGAFLSTIYEYPKLALMGFAAIPAPNLVEQARLFMDGKAALPYFLYSILFSLPPLVYAVAFGVFGVLRLKGRFTSRDAFFFLVTVYGAIIFRSALGRSDGFHFVQVFAPSAFVLAYLSGVSLGAASESRVKMPTLRYMAIFVLPLIFANANFMTTFYEETAENILSVNTVGIVEKIFPEPRPGLVTTSFPELGGIYVPPEVAYHVAELKNFAGRISWDDGVYVLGNSSLTHVLIDRPNPTRFDMYYWAGTTRLQEEVVADLERRKPRYVVVEPGGLLDNIARETQVPVINDYVFSTYQRAQGFYYGTFAVYERG
jgi:hypothetical protein